MDSVVYVPILKWKQGEKQAISELHQDIKEKIAPLIEIPPISLDESGKPKKSLDKHLGSFSRELDSILSSFKYHYVDLFMINDEISESELFSAEFLFNIYEDHNLNYVPVVSSLLNNDIFTKIVEVAENNNTDICIRIRMNDVDDIESELIKYKDVINAFNSRIHLIIDFEYISPDNYGLYSKLGKITLLELDGHYNLFKKVIFSGTSFPESLGEIKAETIYKVPRAEFKIWTKLNNLDITDLTYSDYCISNPNIFDNIDPRFLRPSANIRYTSDDHYIIIKGKLLRKHGFSQFNQLSRELIALNEYSGKDYSSGDNFIYQCANNGQSGNLTTWRKVGTNHHITFVVNQLSNLP